MTSSTRVSRVCGLLHRDTPYRPDTRQVRAVLAVLPQPAHPLARRSLERFAAAVVALPYRIDGDAEEWRRAEQRVRHLSVPYGALLAR